MELVYTTDLKSVAFRSLQVRVLPGVLMSYYLKRQEQYSKTIKARRKKYVNIKRAWLLEYWSTHPCTDCGEDDLIVLEFDHCRGEKLYEVHRLLKDTTGLKRLQKEVEKCDVVCRNCHVRRTAKRHAGWWKDIGVRV